MEKPAFISSFQGSFYHPLQTSLIFNRINTLSRRPWTACAGSNKGTNDNGNKGKFRFYPFNNNINDDNGNENPRFEPFDGSLPLLPAWRPPSMEADFAYNSKRVSSRKTISEDEQMKEIVKIESPGHGTLFAQVVQQVNADDEKENKYWLRPLLLSHDEDSTFVDLRGGSDIFVKRDKVVELDMETKTRVVINLAATESDVLQRAIEDEHWQISGMNALIQFLNTL